MLTAAFFIEVEETGLGVNKPEDTDCYVFSNPADHYFNVLAEAGSTINLYTNTGLLMESRIAKENLTRFDRNDLAGGIYLVEIVNGLSTSFNKVVFMQ